MCKLLVILDIENQKLAERFLKASLPHMTRTDKDGLGTMKLGENGVYINRWVTPPTNLTPFESVKSKYDLALSFDNNIEGIPSREYQAMALHTRQATNAVNIDNTHPFYAEGTALMHNGIVNSAKFGDNKISTCDSEILLWRYVDNSIKDNPSKLTEALNDVNGYYACIVFNDNGTVDIWRDNSATLYLATVRGLGTVIATTSEIILKTCKALKLKVLSLNLILPFTSIRWQTGINPLVSTFTKSYVPKIASIGDYVPQSQYDEMSPIKQSEPWFKREVDREYDKVLKENNLKVGLM